jgi:hypothetical protein
MNAAETTPAEGVVLAYHRPVPSALPRPAVSILLALPAAACWLVLAYFLFRGQIPRGVPVPWFFVMRLGMLSWATAIVVGLFSFAYFWHKPKAWHVIACLLLNGSVLLATAAVLALLTYATWQFD